MVEKDNCRDCGTLAVHVYDNWHAPVMKYDAADECHLPCKPCFIGGNIALFAASVLQWQS